MQKKPASYKYNARLYQTRDYIPENNPFKYCMDFDTLERYYRYIIKDIKPTQELNQFYSERRRELDATINGPKKTNNLRK